MSRTSGRALRAALAGAAVLLMAGCSGALGGGSGGAGTDTDTLTLGLSRQLTSLDPGSSGSIDGDATVQGAIFSSLTKIGPDQKLVGDLATSWRQDSDVQWTFVLRDGVKFSNGDPLDAATVKWNFDRLLDPTTKLTSGPALRAIIARVDAPDAHTVVVTTKKPYLDLDERLSTTTFTEQKWVESHNPVLEPLGSGPYQLQSVDLENGATLVRNPNYYGDKPYYDKVAFKVLGTEAARVQALQSGSVDAAIQLDPQSLTQFAGSDRYTTGSQWSSWNMTLRINETKPPLQDPRVRQALNYAIDKKTIASSLLGPDIQPSSGQVLNAPYDQVNPDLQAYPHDPAKARQLLAEAGYPNGLDLELALSTGTYIASDPIAQAIAQQLGEVGIRIKVTTAQFPSWVQRSYTDDVADLIYIGYSSGYRAPAERLRIYTSTYSQSHFSDPAYDALVDQLTTATSREQQTDLLDRATQEFHDNPHVVFLWPQPLTWAVNKNLDWVPRPEHWLLPQDFRPKNAD
ncbi:ABC transporter substrate-binding protein [Pseudonocardia lutea]|uniref:ABC transporter substrate-binding protein n=1 Tax=Pseudonocardia lutea TaxID=2172015 RepID=A0ABW1ICJ1_9PSEU